MTQPLKVAVTGLKNLIKNGIPVFPDWFVTLMTNSSGHFLRGSGVGDFKLFECIRSGYIAPGFGLTARTHRSHPQGHYMIAIVGVLTSGKRDISIMIKQSEGKCQPSQLPVSNDRLRLKSALSEQYAEQKPLWELSKRMAL